MLISHSLLQSITAIIPNILHLLAPKSPSHQTAKKRVVYTKKNFCLFQFSARVLLTFVGAVCFSFRLLLLLGNCVCFFSQFSRTSVNFESFLVSACFYPKSLTTKKVALTPDHWLSFFPPCVSLFWVFGPYPSFSVLALKFLFSVFVKISFPYVPVGAQLLNPKDSKLTPVMMHTQNLRHCTCNTLFTYNSTCNTR